MRVEFKEERRQHERLKFRSYQSETVFENSVKSHGGEEKNRGNSTMTLNKSRVLLYMQTNEVE